MRQVTMIIFLALVLMGCQPFNLSLDDDVFVVDIAIPEVAIHLECTNFTNILCEGTANGETVPITAVLESNTLTAQYLLDAFAFQIVVMEFLTNPQLTYAITYNPQALEVLAAQAPPCKVILIVENSSKSVPCQAVN